MNACLVSAVLLLLPTQHIVIGLRADAAVTARVEGIVEGIHQSSALGIVEFTEDICSSGPCTATLTTGPASELQIGPLTCAVEAVMEEECHEPWNEAWGFYESGVLIGYVEFHEGLYYTQGWASFGQGYETRRVCNVEDWAVARAEFGVPLGLCVHTLRGLQYCGP